MKYTAIIPLLFLAACSAPETEDEPIVFGQAIDTIHTNVLNAPNDTFSVRFSNSPEDVYPFSVSGRDTTDIGTDGSEGLTVTIYYGDDSLVVPYRNMPYAQVHWIPIESPKGKTVYRLHFNRTTCSLPKEYMQAHDGKVTVEIPEVYELANIIWMLSPKGLQVTNMDTNNEYYLRVKEHFAPYMDHAIFSKFDFADSLNYDKYYEFRENSYCFRFKDDKGHKLAYDGPYYYVMGDDWDNFTSMFSNNINQVADFVKQSGYRQFYKDNIAYYNKLIARQRELMPVDKMWAWMEQEFPDNKFNSYKVVFSPLITGSHSTQQFHEYNNGEWFSEAIMFVCGPESYDKWEGITEEERIGLMSGIVFTEIDHNYINRISYKNSERVNKAMGNRQYWVAEGKATQYGNPMSVFNEYMTHSAFCIYIQDTYDKKTADFVTDRRVQLMADRRGFVQFEAFNNAVTTLCARHPDKKLSELYPEILTWCEGQK